MHSFNTGSVSVCSDKKIIMQKERWSLTPETMVALSEAYA